MSSSSSSLSASLCGSLVASRRALLAFAWSLVTLLAAVVFLIAVIFCVSTEHDNTYDDNNNNNNNNNNPQVAVTSRAMAFAAVWTAVLASLLSLFGTVILGFQSPTGQYYACCSPSVHRTTQLGLGSFIGALFMFANLTLVCSVLFGEFQIRDYDRRDGDPDAEDTSNYNYNNNNYTAVDQSSLAFSVMCFFLTILYGAFAVLTYAFSDSVMEENAQDVRQTSLMAHHHHQHSRSNTSFMTTGYIGERFDVRSTAGQFVAPSTPKETSSMA